MPTFDLNLRGLDGDHYFKTILTSTSFRVLCKETGKCENSLTTTFEYFLYKELVYGPKFWQILLNVTCRCK